MLRAAAGDAAIVGAVVLGSGLGVLMDAWRPRVLAESDCIPGYPRSTVPGHGGRVAVVGWEQHAVLVFQGRVHFYEGYGRAEVTFAVHLAAALGAQWMLLTNASGSVDPLLTPGTILVIEDHFHLFMGRHAARGAAPGPSLRGSPYSEKRTREAFGILGQEGLHTVRGVLFGGLGPTYETAAEVEMIRRLGADVGCMSTVIEAEEAARLGLEVAAVSLVTNLCTGLSARPLDHGEVVALGERVGPDLARGIDRLVRSWCEA
jgi:inosine/guanosine/xanthosine phosphorylase family protein